MSEIKKNLKGFSTFPHDTIAEIQRSARERVFIKFVVWGLKEKFQILTI